MVLDKIKDMLEKQLGIDKSKIAINLFVNVIFCTSFYRNCPFNVIGFN